MSTFVQKYTSRYEKIVVDSMCKYGDGEWRRRDADGEAREHWRIEAVSTEGNNAGGSGVSFGVLDV